MLRNSRILLFLISAILSMGSAYAETLALSSSIKIPMHIRTRPLGIMNLIDVQPVVQVCIESKGHKEKLFFLADTGCTDTTIDIQAAKRLGLPIGEEAFTAIGAHSAFITHKGNLPIFKIGPIVTQQMPVQVMDLSKADYIGNTDGILGVDFWKNYVLTMDYEHNQIELSPFCLPGDKKRAWVVPTFSDDAGRVYVNTVVDGNHHIPMLVDTCSPTTTIPYQKAKEIFGDQVDKKKFSNIDYDINGGKAKVATMATQSFQAGEFGCTGLVLYVTKNSGQGSYDCIIGDDFLRNFCVSFDFPGHRLILEK